LDALVEPYFLTAGKTLCGKCGVTQAVTGNDSCDCPSKAGWGLCRTQENNREGLGQERISSRQCCLRPSPVIAKHLH